MIKITNDKNEFMVTQGVFESQFKNLGYRIVDNKTKISENKNKRINNKNKKEDKKEKETIEEGITRKLQKDRK